MKTLSRAAYIFFCALPPILFCYSCGALMLPLAAAITLHEIGHLAAIRMLGGRIRGFTPAPFGLCINVDDSTLSLFGEAIVSAAGCIVNFISVLVAALLYKFFKIDIIDFGIVSAALALLNLIPAKPLDGGRLLETFTAALFGPNVSYAVSAAAAYIFSFFVFLFASYSLLTSQNGMYPLLFSVYLFACNAKSLEKAVF